MKTFIILLCILITPVVIAQKGPKEKIKTLKIAYITEQLDLSSKEAEKFWPIYNTHQQALESLKKQHRQTMRQLKKNTNATMMNTQEAQDFIDTHLSIEQEKLAIRKKQLLELKNILPPKKVVLLILAEGSFKKKLLRQLRQQPHH